MRSPVRYSTAPLIDDLGTENLCADLSSALKRAYILLPNLMGSFDDDY